MINKNMRPLMAAFFILIFASVACKKKQDGIGTEVLPGDYLLQGQRIDTLSLFAFAIPDDSIRSDRMDVVMLGEYNDPIFGVAKTGFSTQFRLSSNNPNFVPDNGREYVVDSVVLALEYRPGNHYGFRQPQNYAVYELAETLSADSVYFNNRVFPFVSPQNLVLENRRLQRPAPNSAAYVGLDTLVPQLRLPLDIEIGERMIAAGSNNLTTDEFVKFFKGLYVTVENSGFSAGSGGIHYFNLLAANSKLTMYYSEMHIDADTLVSSRVFDFVINNNAVYTTHTSHDFSYAAPDLYNQLQSNPELGQQTLYVQAAGGVKTRINIPHINRLGSDSVAINRAILVVPYKSDNIYAPPQRLFVLRKNENGTSAIIADQFEGDNHIGGFISATDLEYRINITRWVQQVSSGQLENYGLEIFSQLTASSANRVVLYGPENPDRQLKLIIDYTKY
jgi:hypothetical protein